MLNETIIDQILDVAFDVEDDSSVYHIAADYELVKTTFDFGDEITYE